MLGAVTVSPVLSIFGGLLVLAAAAGFIVAYTAASGARSLIELQKNEVEALKNKTERLAQEAAECARKNADLEERMRVLTELVTQAAAVDTLRSEMHERFDLIARNPS